jgi:hypothetical protein
MDQIATLRPWAFVLIAIWLIMWAIKRFVSINNPIYEGIMAILAGVAGVLLLISG